jgi:hypothetical protein
VNLRLTFPAPSQAVLASLCPFKRPDAPNLVASTYTADQNTSSGNRVAIDATAHIRCSSLPPCERSSAAMVLATSGNAAKSMHATMSAFVCSDGFPWTTFVLLNRQRSKSWPEAEAEVESAGFFWAHNGS